VDALNADLRAVRRDRGELAGADMPFETKHGEAACAIGDRAQFTDTDQRAHIYRRNVGTTTAIDAGTRRLPQHWTADAPCRGQPASSRASDTATRARSKRGRGRP
jgi:hypothetical protein